LPGRRFQNGLHEALEAKEDLEIQPAMVTRASISLQSFLSLYRQLAGMSGTLAHDRQTFRKLYGLEVAAIPPHNRVRRFDDRPQVFKTRQEALVALVEDALKVSEAGAPVLIGTPSVALSEQIAGVLAAKRIRFCLLNAKQTGYEAAIIAEAGYPGRITIATNMAGRGTDIKSGGSFESHLSGILEERGLIEKVDRGTLEWNRAVKDAGQKYSDARETVFKAGGLHVLGLGLQSSKRLDEQLIGRAGRQGDPGFSRLYLSLEDELVERNYGTGTPRLVARLRESEKENPAPGNNREYRADSRPISVANPLAIRILKECQTKVEGRNYDNLKLGFEFDLVVNKWRANFYRSRRLILQKCGDEPGPLHSGPPGVTGREICKELERMDQKWAGFLLALEELRQGVAFQALGGRKVLSIYREEAFKLYKCHLHLASG
jgi:preprotein translocase subunit SecA